MFALSWVTGEPASGDGVGRAGLLEQNHPAETIEEQMANADLLWQCNKSLNLGCQFYLSVKSGLELLEHLQVDFFRWYRRL